jgi:hypothetical protein
MRYVSSAGLLLLISMLPGSEEKTFEYSQIASGEFLEAVKAPSLYEGESMELATMLGDDIVIAKMPYSHRGTGGVPFYIFTKNEDRYVMRASMLSRSLYSSESGGYLQLFGYHRLGGRTGSIHAVRIRIDGTEFASGDMPIVMTDGGFAVGNLLWKAIMENAQEVAFTPTSGGRHAPGKSTD